MAEAVAATVGTFFADASLRDSVLGLFVTDDRDAKGGLCATAARRLKGSARSAAVTIYAAARYIAGDDSRAGFAIDAALTANPGNRLIDLSLTHGAPPAFIRVAARSAAESPDTSNQ